MEWGGAATPPQLMVGLRCRAAHFSDPVGDKLSFLKNAVTKGYTVVRWFIGISDPDIAEERVLMRVSQGGHDVPTEKLIA